jgi:hypothetical protein
MMTDGLTEKQSGGVAEDVEVLDVAQLLLTSVKRGDATGNGAAAADRADGAPADQSAAPPDQSTARPDPSTARPDP